MDTKLIKQQQQESRNKIKGQNNNHLTITLQRLVSYSTLNKFPAQEL